MLVTVGFLTLGLLKVNSTLLAASSSIAWVSEATCTESETSLTAGCWNKWIMGALGWAPAVLSAFLPSIMARG